MAYLEATNIKSGYARKTILHDISFLIEKGESIGIIGPNGAGKTTLLKTMTHIIAPSSGNIFLEQKDIHKISSREIAKRFAIVGQDIKNTFSFTVKEILLMGRNPYIGIFGSETKEDIEIVDNIIRQTVLSDFIDRPIDSLSAGERQRVLIAKALVQQPEVILLDEPTAHLDIGCQIDILDLVKSLNQERGLTVISVLHDLNLASQYCDRILMLDKGEVVEFSPPEKLLRYDIIEKVFKAPILVDDKLLKGKPLVIPLTKKL